MENEKIPLKPVVSQKLDCGPESPIQLPTFAIEFNEMQNESENEIDFLSADGEGNHTVHDVAEFHAVMDSILENLDILIHVIEDAGPQDVDLSVSSDTDFSGKLSEQHNVTDDSGLCNSLSDEFIKLIDS
ncbi:hypothetical protein HA402_001413 [Bradysia odoriphaga]|nr:hypothetical protein HA402_001413 [Bradysia odoriphaga]